MAVVILLATYGPAQCHTRSHNLANEISTFTTTTYHLAILNLFTGMNPVCCEALSEPGRRPASLAYSCCTEVCT